ncbi:MAG: hypothetical protein ABSA78_16215 [Candidatus Sulfotelmatobacter sp.]
MHVLIIANGSGHDTQSVQYADDSAAGKDLKAEFETLLKRRIAERGVQFIGEEAKSGVQTIAQFLGPRRENIDMCVAEREARGIAEEQRGRTTEPRYLGEDACSGLTEDGYQKEVGNGWVLVTHRLPSDEVREQYMFDRVMQEVGDADSVLVVCGISHSRQLAEKFRHEAGNVVEIEYWEPK